MRVFDASVHNRIANDPLVRPSFAWAEGDLSFDDEVSRPDDYVFLANEEGDAAAIFEWSAPGTYQVHTMALGSCRGRRALDTGARMIAWMFDREGALMLWGMTPAYNRAARMFNRMIGARSQGMREHFVTGSCEIFVWKPAW
jgi:hypothetical protein